MSRLRPLDFTRAAAFRIRRRARDAVDSAGGLRRSERRGRAWAARWTAEWKRAGAAAWLRRPGAGRLWVDLAEAEAWCRSTCEPADLDIARDAVRGRFDLIGSGRVELGDGPAWRRDLYSGALWPLGRSSRYAIVRGDGSDIRTVWELSRFYHVLPLARAAWTTGEAAFAGAFERHVRSWIDDDPLGYGPHWASPMDAALRAANWTVGAVLFAAREDLSGDLWPPFLANLFATGLWLERHLEWHPVHRGNHFVADAVGLVYLGAFFRGAPEAERWLRRGARILDREILHQVREDGVSFEGSVGYHRLAAELFACGGEVVRRNAPELLGPHYGPRLDAMLRFIAAYLPASGDAPMIGDADDGRVHLFRAAAARQPRRHALGLPPWLELPPAPASADFPHGGFYVLRAGDDHAVVRCGAVGLDGAGSHDHDDQLSLELGLAGRRVLADLGTFCYTRDLAARHAFRATASHNVLQIGAEESNPIDPRRPWRILEDRTRSRALAWRAGPGAATLVAEHSGYAHRASGATCRRTVSAIEPGRWIVEDRVDGRGVEDVTVRFHLAPGLTPEIRAPDLVAVHGEGIRVLFRFALPAAMTLRTAAVRGSDAYGVLDDREVIVASGSVRLPIMIETRLENTPDE